MSLSEIESVEIVKRPRSFRQAGILVLDASGSMKDPVDSLAGGTKAAAVNDAVREFFTRFKVSSKSANFDFATVSFHSDVSHTVPIAPVDAIDDNGNWDPTQWGTGGTFIGSGLEEAGRLATEYLADPTVDQELNSSVVILVMSDGECFEAERTRQIADAIKASDPRVTIAAAYFATKGNPAGGGTTLLRGIASDPVEFYKTVYDAETLRNFFISSQSAAASRAGVTEELFR